MISCYELRLGNQVLVNGNLQRVSMITGTSVFTVDPEESSDQAATEYNLEMILSRCPYLTL